MNELLVFIRGMANFRHNRGTKRKQERLIRDQLGTRHALLGVFEDSGNYAFATTWGADRLCLDVLTALRSKYKVNAAVVVPRAEAAEALAALEQAARARYGDAFSPKDYGVRRAPGRWRVGCVFVSCEIPETRAADLLALDTPTLCVMTVTRQVVGVSKLDTGRRIPWGNPAGVVSRLFDEGTPHLLTTGRSARTVRGTLRCFPAPSAPRRQVTSSRTSDARPVPQPGATGPTTGKLPTEKRRTAMPPNQGAAESCRGLEQRLRQHRKLQSLAEPTIQAFVGLATRVCAHDPERITVNTDLRGFIPFGFRDAPGNEKNFTDTYRFQKDRIVLALKTCERDGLSFQDENRQTTRLQAPEDRFKPYDRKATLRTASDVPGMLGLVLQCYENFLRRNKSKQGGRSQGPAHPRHERTEVPVNFSMVRDERLREQLLNDWEEANRVHNQSQAWKSCIVLCRGIIEGMLIDALERDEAQAQRLYRGREKSPLADWDLKDVIQVAEGLRILDRATAKRCDALRDDGNLIHPVRQVRQRITVGETKAGLALATVRECHENLLRRAEGGGG